MVMATSVMSVMKMGNCVPIVGIEPTPLAFQVSVLTITPPRLPAVTMLPIPTCVYDFSVQTTTISLACLL